MDMDVRLVWARVGCHAYMKYVWVFYSGNDAVLSFRLVSINPKKFSIFSTSPSHLTSHAFASTSGVTLSLPLPQFCGLSMFWNATKPQRAKNKTWIEYKNIEKSTNHFVGLTLELGEQKMFYFFLVGNSMQVVVFQGNWIQQIHFSLVCIIIKRKPLLDLGANWRHYF